MVEPQSSVHNRFFQTCKASGISAQHTDAIWKVIYQHYTREDRHYHNLCHLSSMFDFIQRTLDTGFSLQDPAAVDWAVWFHDVIYDPRSATNEADSAELAAQLLLPAGVPPDSVRKVQRYILATAGHQLEQPDGDGSSSGGSGDDADGALLLDADLCILGAAPQRYAEYAAAVRREYAHLSDQEFAQGRAQVLRGMLDRQQLFLTHYGKTACEAAARANLSTELSLVNRGQLLQAGPPDA